MAEVTAPLALDETLQQVVAKLGNVSSVAGASAYTQAVAGGYTGTEAEFEAQIAKQPIVVNPNLLDNAYFVGGGSQQGGGQFPISQKGATTWTVGSTSDYILDRWYAARGTFALNSNGINVVWNGTQSTTGWIQQRTNHRLGGKRLTVSVLLSNGQLLTGTAIQTTTGNASTTYYNSGGYYINVTTFASDNTLSFVFLTEKTSDSSSIVACKLELGDTQTLCHNEGTDANPVWVLNEIPNYTEELWKCQRYYQLFANSSYRPTYGEDFRPPMRIHQPTLGTISIGGTTYYYAAAEQK